MADAVHAWLIKNDVAYRASVAAGQTAQWALPKQELDDGGDPIKGGKWFIPLKQRALSALSGRDRKALVN